MSHEFTFVRTTENQQALSRTQGPPCLPLSQGPLGKAASPPALRPPTSLPHRHTLTDGHTRTPHRCTLLTVLHCQVQVCGAMQHSLPLSAMMPGVLHGQLSSVQLTLCVLLWPVFAPSGGSMLPDGQIWICPGQILPPPNPPPGLNTQNNKVEMVNVLV